MVATRIESITADDGVTFDGFLALPDAGSGPGVLVIQEIFGVNQYIQHVCKRLAALGYVALAPDAFHRQEPGFAVDRTGPEAVGEGVAKASKHDAARGVADLGNALAHLRAMPEVGGAKVGVTGFCFGGLMTYLVAKNFDPDAAVSYYGSNIANLLDGVAEQLTCPTLFHFGDNDPFLPNSDVDKIRAATADMAHVTVRQYWMGGHAFDNAFSPFYQPYQANEAWGHTTAFFARHLG
ncbi:MAG: dienelactone hydrolase family protein [Acidimicrobiales bacterium]|jgi:carboxymethylenebutenolidase|nr:dienelactone hydrolase family protein [Acidimicrobiales bacterium]